jgi:hypothetical protein
MNRAVAEALLEQELTAALEMGYEQLGRLIGSDPILKVVPGSDGKLYVVEISAYWDARENGPVRLTAVIDDGGLRALIIPLTADCVVDPSWKAPA